MAGVGVATATATGGVVAEEASTLENLLRSRFPLGIHQENVGLLRDSITQLKTKGRWDRIEEGCR